MLPKLYNDLAGWFHLLTAPVDYADEAAAYRRAIVDASAETPRTLLELGSGGGNNASHLKQHFECTLTDVSPRMLEISRGLNPECTHLLGDMRELRLGRQFDAVFVHDAVMYITAEDDLRAVVDTAYAHCKPDGVALFAPDCVRETFVPRTDHGGHDGEERALRYVEWSWDPDPEDTTFIHDMAYILRENGDTRVVHDRHIYGLFPRATWQRLLRDAGFAEVRIDTRPEDDGELGEVFVGIRPAPSGRSATRES